MEGGGALAQHVVHRGVHPVPVDGVVGVGPGDAEARGPEVLPDPGVAVLQPLPGHGGGLLHGRHGLPLHPLQQLLGGRLV